MLGGAFATFTISAGLMHSYAVFLVAFLEDFRWSRSDVSLAYSASQLVAGVSAPLVGALVDRLGPRRLVLLGGTLLALGLLGSAYARALWHIIVLYGVVMTIGANCLGLVVFVPLLSQWFVRRRGMAISIVQSANGFGRAASAPLAQLLISAIGWRRAYLAQAALMVALVLPLAGFFRGTDPSAAATRTAPESPQEPPEVAAPSDRDWTVGDAMRTRHFWLLSIVYLCTGLGSFFVSLHQLAFAVDVGFDKLYAATVLGLGSFTRPTHHVSSPTKAAVVPVISASPSASPSPVAASTSARAAATTMPATTAPATPRRSPSPAKVTLGTLTRADPAAFCMDSMAGWARMQRANNSD